MIKIHQIYFRKNQLPTLDPAFIPYDNSKCREPGLREFYVFRKEYLAGATKSGYTGYISWKFGAKTGIEGQKFVNFINAKPGYDFYFINPFPMEISRGNVWQQGDRIHPGIIDIANRVFFDLGYNIDVQSLPKNLRTLAYCNFWVASSSGWDQYMKFCLPVYDYIMNELNEPYRSKVFSKADALSRAPYFAYIFERLFTTFLQTTNGLKFIQYDFTDEEMAKNRLSKDEIAIVREIKLIELNQPGVAEPITSNPVLISALRFYELHMFDRHPFKEALFVALHSMWMRFPLRNRLVQSHVFRKLKSLTVRRLMPN